MGSGKADLAKSKEAASFPNQTLAKVQEEVFHLRHKKNSDKSLKATCPMKNVH